MTKKTKPTTKRAAANAAIAPGTTTRTPTRGETMIALMRSDHGATAAELGAAVGWQKHSVRGFIAGSLKKRADLHVTAFRDEGPTRYRITDNVAV